MGAMQVHIRSKRPNLGTANPEINITPLVDVVLVLLIIFMVIAPALNEGAPIELPKVFAADPKPRDISPISVLVLNDGTMLLNDKPIARAEFAAKLVEVHQQDPNRSVLLKSDQNTEYRLIRDVFAAVQNVGFKGVLLKVTTKQDSDKNG